MSPTHDAWRRFRAWVKHAVSSGVDPVVDGTVPGEWFRQFKINGQADSMWEIWLLRFMHDQGLYTLYPWIRDGSETIVCNWREKGLHYDSGGRDFPLSADLPRDLLTHSFVPYADWGLALHYCFDNNDAISKATALQIATEKRKILRWSSFPRDETCAKE